MNASRSLPVLMPKVSGQRWSCHSCGHCCRSLVGSLSESERATIDEQGWTGKLGVAPYVRVGRGWALNKHDDGTCVFLEDDRCMIHRDFGESQKPLACRIFPFSVREAVHGWQASLRFDCPSVIESKGEPILQHRPSVSALAHMLPWRGLTKHEVDLSRGLPATPDEIDAVIGRVSRSLAAGGAPLVVRLIDLARATTTLHEARYEKVRGPRFAELLDLLMGAAGQSPSGMPDRPTPRHRGFLRQLAFAHAEHLTLQQRRSLFARAARRWEQLRSAKKFLRGRGLVPRLPELTYGPTFDEVEAVSPADTDRERIEDLLQRYLLSRLQGQSVFGRGYYGWPMFGGLTALWLSVGVVGWLARYRAAGEHRERLTFEDVGRVLGVVDRAASRLPALGTLAERARVRYLLREDGVARLLVAYRLVDNEG